jgi:hypothetical protein
MPITDTRATRTIVHEAGGTLFSTALLGCDWVALLEILEEIEGHVKLLPSGPNKYGTQFYKRPSVTNHIQIAANPIL